MSVRLAVILYRNEQGIVVPPQVLATDNKRVRRDSGNIRQNRLNY